MNRKTNYSQPHSLSGKTQTTMNRKTNYSQPQPRTLGGIQNPTPLTIGGGKTQTTTMIGKTQGMIHSWMIQTMNLTINFRMINSSPMITSSRMTGTMDLTI